nr:integral membrane protein, YccS/YhfK family [Candidatus Pantoea persica]
MERSHAEAVIRWNAKIISARLRAPADAIIYHQLPSRFEMEKPLSALEKIARQHPDNPVGHFCYNHFSRIARVLRTQKPLYPHDLMTYRQRRLPLLPALRSYLSRKSAALRTAANFAVILMFGSTLALLFNMPKPYWILMTIMFVSQNGYSATRVRIQHRALGTFAGLVIAAASLLFAVPESLVLLFILVVTLLSYLVTRKYYGWSMIGFTVTAVYSLQLLSLNGAQFLLPRLMDMLMGLPDRLWQHSVWPQWQSGLLLQNAHDVLETYQDALRLLRLLRSDQEPGFNAQYLKDMRLWVTHSQFIVEHINAMTILAHEHTMLTPNLVQRYLQSCEIALQRCQRRLEYDGPGPHTNVMESGSRPCPPPAQSPPLPPPRSGYRAPCWRAAASASQRTARGASARQPAPSGY